MLIYKDLSLKIASKFTLLFLTTLLITNITPSNLLLITITINLDRMIGLIDEPINYKLEVGYWPLHKHQGFLLTYVSFLANL